MEIWLVDLFFFFQGRNFVLSKFSCLAALGNWPLENNIKSTEALAGPGLQRKVTELVKKKKIVKITDLHKNLHGLMI